ncbi:YraN family protein [Fluoribacter dumoffii]|uniref:YraN family protein n=1 Tax=Fluoribacter dumoffii TaxID=463 RepID=UPI0022443843|nr:YraN family protein [Fluoribacter dumoffii]MCW8417095.1 YraN family protein [Fluoribacter dumoffii]MCW8455065.1 YraN family protein [Fluoribacter dumoffii]MCW8460858.1 YraN family protein [Fluoribacter dumoffii]MCW8484300.1 YraN family protein [Fluoribacter dumoffii]
MTQEKGRLAEERALAYLKKQGLKLITQNYSCRLGEIDLIMRDEEHLVFIEVRSRVSTLFGGGIASVTYAKRKKILKTATNYMLAHQKYNQLALRFDVVSIDGESATITWVRDAFGADY